VNIAGSLANIHDDHPDARETSDSRQGPRPFSPTSEYTKTRRRLLENLAARFESAHPGAAGSYLA
jgi:hypothetical protein